MDVGFLVSHTLDQYFSKRDADWFETGSHTAQVGSPNSQLRLALASQIMKLKVRVTTPISLCVLVAPVAKGSWGSWDPVRAECCLTLAQSQVCLAASVSRGPKDEDGSSGELLSR